MAQQPQEPDQDMKNIVIENLQMNSMRYNRFQTVLYIVGGTICGILGLTDLSGLLFYMALSVVVASLITIRMKFNTKLYANISFFKMLLQATTSHLLSFILFWTMSYALVYIY